MRLICPCTLFCFSNSRQSKQNTLLSQTASDAQYALTSRRDSNSSFELGGTLLMSGVSLLMSHDDDLKAGMADVSYIVAGSCVRGRCQGEKCPRFRPTDTTHLPRTSNFPQSRRGGIETMHRSAAGWPPRPTAISPDPIPISLMGGRGKSGNFN